MAYPLLPSPDGSTDLTELIIKQSVSILLLIFLAGFIYIFLISIQCPCCHEDEEEEASLNGDIENAVEEVADAGLPDYLPLPALAYGSQGHIESAIESEQCAICLEDFKVGDEFKLLPACNHAFHDSCIRTWLTKKRNCPICRCVLVYPNCLTDLAC